MPATCFKRLPPSAGVIAQRCRLSLQPLSEAWFALRARSSVSQRLVCTGGLKCMHRRTRTAAGAGVCGCAALACFAC